MLGVCSSEFDKVPPLKRRLSDVYRSTLKAKSTKASNTANPALEKRVLIKLPAKYALLFRNAMVGNRMVGF